MQLTKMTLTAAVVFFGALVDARPVVSGRLSLQKTTTPCEGCSPNKPLQDRRLAIEQFAPHQHIGFLDRLWGKQFNHIAADSEHTKHQIHNLPSYPHIKPRNFNASDFLSAFRPYHNTTGLQPHIMTEAIPKAMETLLNATSKIVGGGRLLPVLPANWNLTSILPILPRNAQDTNADQLNATELLSTSTQDSNSTDGVFQVASGHNGVPRKRPSAATLEALPSRPITARPRLPLPQIPPQSWNRTGIPQPANLTTTYHRSNLDALLPNTTTIGRPSLSYFSYQEINRAVKHLQATNQTETPEGIAFTQLYNTLRALNEEKGRIPSDRIKAMGASFQA